MARKTISALAIGAVLALASPALANSNNALVSGTATKTATNPDQRYCFKTEATGTRILKTVCMTSAAWAAEGVDVSRYTKR